MNRITTYVTCGLVGGIAGALLVLVAQPNQPIGSGATTSATDGAEQVQLQEYIATVKRQLAAAQKSSDGGPPFLVESFDLEAHVQADRRSTQEGGVSQGIILNLSQSQSQGTSHLIKLHLRTAAFEQVQQVVKDCAEQYIGPSSGSFGTNQQQLTGMLAEANESEFEDCVRDNLPDGLEPVLNSIEPLTNILFSLQGALNP